MKTPRFSLLSATLPLCLGLVLGAQVASANPAELSDTGRAILQAYQSNMIDCDPDETPDAERFDTCQRVVRSQRKRLARIKGPDRKHPAFREMSTYQARLENANKRWRAGKEQEHDDNRKQDELSSSFERELNDSGFILWFLSDLERDTGRLGVADVDPHAVAKYLKAASALDSLATHCATRFAPILESQKLVGRITADRAPKPNKSCELAKKSQRLLRRWFPRAVKAHVKRIETILKKEVKDIKETGKASNTILSALKKSAVQSQIDQDLKAYSPSAKALGVKLSAKTFSALAKSGDTSAPGDQEGGENTSSSTQVDEHIDHQGSQTSSQGDRTQIPERSDWSQRTERSKRTSEGYRFAKSGAGSFWRRKLVSHFVGSTASKRLPNTAEVAAISLRLPSFADGAFILPPVVEPRLFVVQADCTRSSEQVQKQENRTARLPVAWPSCSR